MEVLKIRRALASHPLYLVRKMTKVGQQAMKQGAFFSDL
jgi:hypothetical protein